MIFRIYKNIDPSVIFLILLLAAVGWFSPVYHSIHSSFPEYTFEMPFYYWIYIYLTKFPVLAHVFIFLFLLFQTYFMSRFNNKFFLLETQSYLPSVFFILLINAFIIPEDLVPALFGNLFILLAINKVFDTYRKDQNWLNYFDAGLLIALGSLFYIKLAYYILLVWISLMILRPFRSREWLVSLFGFLLPYIFVISYFYIFQDIFLYKIQLFVHNLFIFKYIINVTTPYILFFSLLIFLILLSSFLILFLFQKKKVSVRKFFQVFLWLFIITLVLFALSGFRDYKILIFAAMPLAYLFANYFISIKSTFWYEVLFTLFFASIVYIQISIYYR